MKENELSSKDLMIGDWLQDSFGNIGQVYRLDPGRVHLRLLQERPQDEEYIVHDIEPIPLTPEILEKNGFEVERGGKIMGMQVADKCTLCIGDGIKKCRIEMQDYGETEHRKWATKITALDEVRVGIGYVHQLQHALRLCRINKEIVV